MQVKPNGAMMESGEKIAVPVWFTAKKGTNTMELGGVDLFEVSAGKIIQVWTFSYDQKVDDEFWGK